MAAPVHQKGAHVKGAARAKLIKQLARQYLKGKTIRELAEHYGFSYGTLRRLLLEGNVPLRMRGGRGKRPRKSTKRP